MLDAGAVRAVVERGTSLLPAGVTGVEGTFEAGDPVELVGPDGALIGRGLVAYDAARGAAAARPLDAATCAPSSAPATTVSSSTATTWCWSAGAADAAALPTVRERSAPAPRRATSLASA